MAGRGGRAGVIDASAVTLSGLCIIHCLALPIMSAALMPIFGAWAEAEWVHKLFVAVALPTSGLAIVRSWPSPCGKSFTSLALFGLSLLVVSAFVEALHNHEMLLTVTGALVLASAHIWRWTQHRACDGEDICRSEEEGAGCPRH